MRNKTIKVGKVYVGDREIGELTADEREAFSARCVERIGKAINSYYSAHPEALRNPPAYIREAPSLRDTETRERIAVCGQ